MTAIITRSPYPEIQNGTMAKIIDSFPDGYALEVESNFTVPAATATVRKEKRIFFFGKDECQAVN